jgi:hypothetical protein
VLLDIDVMRRKLVWDTQSAEWIATSSVPALCSEMQEPCAMPRYDPH